jgi:nucleoid DNA-binding protein
MNHRELAEEIRKNHGLSWAESSRILETVIETIREELKQGHLVRLRNFGTFQARKSHGKIRAKFNASKNFFEL